MRAALPSDQYEVTPWHVLADFYNKTVFFIAFLVGTIGYLVGEAAIVMKTRVPYIEPETPQTRA